MRLHLLNHYPARFTESLSGSITAGLHQQKEQDLDDDGWLDMASYTRATMRPRLYFTGDNGTNVYVTFGAMTEQREGGTIDGATMPDSNPFAQTQDTTRLDSGFIYDQPLGDVLNLNMRGSAMQQEHDHVFGLSIENDKHQSYLLESSVSGYSESAAWLVGVALQNDKFTSYAFPEFNYSYQVPGLFTQLDYDASENIALSFSARNDWHNEYGNQFSPRISLLYKPENWILRTSYGQGYFAPTPFIDDIENSGLARLAPFENIHEEHANTASIDVSYVVDNIESSMTLFASNIDDVAELQEITAPITNGKRVQIVNVPGQTEVRGAELLLRYRWHDIKLTGSYLYTDATKQNTLSSGRSPLTLTPKHSAGAVVMWEEHGSHLVGFEAYYTGTQHLEGNPYRDKSDAYWHLGLLGQITLGRVSWFLNAENLLNVRQTKEDSLILPAQAASGPWTTDIWSRNDGFTVNAGVRIRFGD